MEPLDQLRRLHALRPQRATPEATPAHSSTHSGAANEDRYGDASPSERALERLVPGAVVETEVGACYVTSHAYPRQELRGVFALGDLLPRRPGLLAPFHPVARLDESPDFAGAVFLDTETTGLGAAPSVYAFMVGVGTYEMIAQPGATVAEAHYVVRQFFMRSPGEEPALLVALADLLRDRTLMVSFNGRSFDLPLLRTRYAVNQRYLPRSAHDLPLLQHDAPHLDLLLPARRLWKRRLQSCRLANLENEILGLRRGEDDVPGALIPQMYVDYVRSGNARQMQRVFYHNREDIVSTAAIAAQLCHMVEQPHHADSGLMGLDWLGLGASWESAGRSEDAIEAYQRALDGVSDPGHQRDIFRRLAALLKRLRRWDDAVSTWELWLSTVPGGDATPFIELSKHYEWQARDLAQAEAWTAFGLHTLRTLPAWQRLPGQMGDLEQRLLRIQRKRAAPRD